ncbi:hypothetical protein OCJ37_14440 [Xanthomonas sp. AM6]|uniref:hypothetical protein n=1 Tax=Xanthomonas sp. AM6 TaxID=2982531 RepID=UPI0021D8FE43|nr:hypothetical protein [Xanthomonas sp. AM6]UYB51184.1 hypothetical protein OCJ37_14440 [Xanthomonas sp. AM6]
MDFSSIATVIASLKTAQDIAVATLGVRDFNESAAAISKINEQLLAAQQGLLIHNTTLLQLQQQHFETAEELRKLKESLAEKNRYGLFDIGGGVFVYRVDVVPQEGGTGEPGATQPQHYLCQPCWDKGTKSVLQRWGATTWKCTICNQLYAPRAPDGTRLANDSSVLTFTTGQWR